MQIGFVHIPKTGGRSLVAYLESWSGQPVRQLARNAEMLDENWSHPKMGEWVSFAGHQPAATMRLLCPDLLVTLVRHPVERVISAFNYVWSKPTHRLRPYFEQNRTDLRSFLDDPKLQYHSRNKQTRFLGLQDDTAFVASRHFRGERIHGAKELYESYLEQPIGIGNLDAAKRTLYREIAFTTTTLLDEAAPVMARYLGIESPLTGRFHENKTQFQRISPWDPDAVRIVASRNQLDLDLYNFSLSLLGRKRLYVPDRSKRLDLRVTNW